MEMQICISCTCSANEDIQYISEGEGLSVKQ